MKKKAAIIGGLFIALLVIFFIVEGDPSGETAEILTTVKKGKFEVRIITTGELEAKNSVQIMGPTSLRNFRIYQVNIQKIEEEGKVVKKGDWIATLDPSELSTKINDAQTRVDQEQSQYKQTQLDTTLQMRQARNELINLKYAVEEQQIVLEQSQFEPPATIKQAEINVDKAERAYRQAKENNKIKLEQHQTKMFQVGTALNKARRELDALLDLRKLFTIRAPEDGMLIYKKGWDGRAVKEGAQISAWDPVVATLPDLSVMLSKTYVNEVDVRKVKAGQPVEVGLDAFPDKKLKGKVISVANVGEQRPNSDAKVFQVNIELFGTDPLLKPSMTTSNQIITTAIDDALFVPLETLHSEHDSITYVYLKDGINTSRQEVIVGETNADEAQILGGLNEGDRLYLSVPSPTAELALNLLPEMDGKRMKKEEEHEIVQTEVNVQKATVKDSGNKRKKSVTKKNN